VGEPAAETETTVGAALKAALQAQARQEAAAPAAAPQEEDKQPTATAKRCADCWHATTFRGPDGQLCARCELNLWTRPWYSLDDLNNDRVRRWYKDCPEYDDSD